MSRLGRFLYYMILSLWVGGASMYTFIITPVVFSIHSRDQAAEIVAPFFPYYFKHNLALSALLLVVILAFASLRKRPRHTLAVTLAALAVVVNIYVTFFLYPSVTEVRGMIESFGPETEGSPERAHFTRLHGVSAVLNLLVLLDGVVLLYLGTASSGRGGESGRNGKTARRRRRALPGFNPQDPDEAAEDPAPAPAPAGDAEDTGPESR